MKADERTPSWKYDNLKSPLQHCKKTRTHKVKHKGLFNPNPCMWVRCSDTKIGKVTYWMPLPLKQASCSKQPGSPGAPFTPLLAITPRSR
jgi:hypothetical protein